MNNKLFIGKIPGSVSSSEVRNCFEQLLHVHSSIQNPIISLELIPHDTVPLANKGIAILTVRSKHDFEFLKANPPNINGRLLKVEEYLDGERRQKLKEEFNKRRLFLTNIPNWCEDKDLQRFFSQFGELESCYRIHEQSTKTPKGYGFITYKEKKVAQKVIEMSPINLKGTNIKMEWFNPNKGLQNRGNESSNKEYKNLRTNNKQRSPNWMSKNPKVQNHRRIDPDLPNNQIHISSQNYQNQYIKEAKKASFKTSNQQMHHTHSENSHKINQTNSYQSSLEASNIREREFTLRVQSSETAHIQNPHHVIMKESFTKQHLTESKKLEPHGRTPWSNPDLYQQSTFSSLHSQHQATLMNSNMFLKSQKEFFNTKVKVGRQSNYKLNILSCRDLDHRYSNLSFRIVKENNIQIINPTSQSPDDQRNGYLSN